MTLTAGAITVVSTTSTTASLSVAAATGGSGPYTYQWYRSTVSGFTPGGGNIISGATALTLADTGLIPNTTYYYTNVVTDTGDSNVTEESTEEAAVTAPQVLSQNQFAQSPYVGQVDLRYNYNTVSVQIDVAETETLYSGGAVKIVDSAGGVPKVRKCTADNDQVLGFINFDIKSQGFTAGMMAEISMAGNVMFLYATAAIARGVRVVLDVTTSGGVAAATGSGSERIVGWAFDKASQAGQLIRVHLLTPSFAVDA